MLVSRNILGFSVAPGMCRVMETNGFFASIMKAEKKKKGDASGLPLGTPIPVLPVDFLKDRPDFWVGGIGSYACPVDDDWALWFNWSMNVNDIAVLTSVKGMNPITGQRVNGLGLEQYQNKCPIHKIDFKHGRFCSECGFKWPDQNYVSSPNPLYWDGFRSSDGKVRQFYFTEDMSKSVPELVIGKEDTVPAFGFCFYKPHDARVYDAGGNRLKDKFPECASSSFYFAELDTSSLRVPSGSGGGRSGLLGAFSMPGVYARTIDRGDMKEVKGVYGHSGGSIRYKKGDERIMFCASTTTPAPVNGSMCYASNSIGIADSLEATKGTIIGMSSSESIRSLNAEVGIGAGESISQQLRKDVKSVTDWQDKPAGIVRIYFVFREQFEKYVSAGLNDLTGYKEGFLNGVPVGGAK